MHKQYRYKFYLNASHFIKINNIPGEIHPHTWEITIDILELQDNFNEFSNIEKIIDEIIEPFQDKLINDVAPFNETNPTLENICEYFKNLIEQRMIEIGYLLLTIGMSETPSRSFIINLIDEI